MSRAATTAAPIDGVDLLLADLDGVVYQGAHAIPHAVESIERAGLPTLFVTNNASRTAASVAAHLSSFGLRVDEHGVVTSPQAAMGLLAPHVREGESVLVVGGEGLTSEVERRGWRVVRTAAEQPVAVVQGFSPDVRWRDLAEASFALHTGIPWVATNTDWTIPVEGGVAPGNGTLVSAVHTAVARMADVAGKPETPIFELALARHPAKQPLMVGDRLDTDILGANRAGIDAALVLTGIDRAKAVIGADESMRPRYIVEDLRGLFEPYPVTRETLERSTGDVYFEVGRAAVRRSGIDVALVRAGERPVDTVRAACAAVWSASVSVRALRVEPALIAA